MKDRYVLVAFDKHSGHVYVATDMLRDHYTKQEVEDVVKFTPKAMKELRDFHVMPYDKAVQIWYAKQQYEWDEVKKVLH